MGINEIEISPSGRAICISCKSKIGIGTPRGVIIVENKNYGSSSSYVCYKCVLGYIENEVLHQNSLKKSLNKLIKRQSKEIILMELDKDGV